MKNNWLLLTAILFIVYQASAQKQAIDVTFADTTLKMASFPGGNTAWIAFLQKNMNAKLGLNIPLPVNQTTVKQTVLVQFLVDTSGALSNITIINKDHVLPSLAAEAVRIFSLSPNWVPGIQNGRKVKCWLKQPLTWVSRQ
jgi:periplasmic protein TonB